MVLWSDDGKVFSLAGTINKRDLLQMASDTVDPSVKREDSTNRPECLTASLRPELRKQFETSWQSPA
jgi:hypothetical protein